MEKTDKSVVVEFQQLQRLFRSKFSVESEKKDCNTVHIEGFNTTDPDFDRKTLPKGITLEIQFQSTLPQTKVRIIGDSLPNELKAKLNEELSFKVNTHAGKVRQVLKWLDRRLGQEKRVVRNGDTGKRESQQFESRWTLNQQIALENALAKYPATLKATDRWKLIAHEVPGKSIKECALRYNYLREKLLRRKEENKRKWQEKLAKASRLSETESITAISQGIKRFEVESNPQHEIYKNLPGILDMCNYDGNKIKIEELTIRNIGYLFVEKILVQATCTKCGLERDVELKVSASKFRNWCKCALLHVLEFEPNLLHEGNVEMLGGIKEAGLVVKDILSLNFVVACLQCGSQQVIENCLRNRPKQGICHTCNVRFHFLYQNLSFSGKPEKILRIGQKSRRSHARRDPRIIPGKALPDNGTCKHYRKSYRWLHFPCCNKAYPCDVCHELGSGCAEPKWATRQICGFCAHEQQYSKDLPCVKCERVIGVRKGSMFWEGGKGCRDQTKMSSKDSKKHVNSSAKTKCNKTNRVGKQGSQAIQARAARR